MCFRRLLSAFGAPSTPSVPQDDFVFKSFNWDTPPAPSLMTIGPTVSATVSLSSANGGRYDNTSLPNGFCDIKDSELGEPTQKQDVMFVPDMSVGSRQERYILPLVTGKMGVVFICDAVENRPSTDPASRYYGKVLLTVIP